MSDDDVHTGTLILTSQPGRSLTWHHSVEFDGYVHTTACGRTVDCDNIHTVELDPIETWHETVTPSDGCSSCYDSVQELRETQDCVLTDGGLDVGIEEIGVAKGEGELWGEVADRLRGRDDDRWHYCVCGARYRNRRPALQCCSQRFAEIVTGGRQSIDGTERDEAARYVVGNEIARRLRTETSRLEVLRDELPELTDKELRILHDNIGKAIRDQVITALRKRTVATENGQDEDIVTDGGQDQDDIIHEVTERDVSDISKAALYAEWSQAYEQLLGTVPDDRRDELWSRRHDLWSEMRDRTDAEPPACPECGHTKWQQEFGGPKSCCGCGWTPTADEMDLIDAIDRYWSTVQSIGEDAADQLVTDGGRPAFIDPQTEWVECWICGQHIEDMSRVEGIDISGPEEYYPEMKPVCPDCDGEVIEDGDDPTVVTDGGRDQTPLDRLFVEDVDDRPDEIVVENLTTLDADEFVARLESLAEAAETVSKLTADLERLRQTGLSDDDARDLIYGRNSGVAKRDIEALFDAVDQLKDGRTKRDPAERLLAEVSGLSLSETAELMDELGRLRRRYGGGSDA